MAIGGTAAGAVPAALVGNPMTAPLRTRKAAPRPERVADPPDAGSATPGTDTSRCRCGHDAAAHEHYRPGSDCGACGAAHCARYRPVGRLRAVRRWMRRAG
jgi:hypothetical protein